MTEYRFLVFTNPVEGKDLEFNTWYDERHVPDVLAVPGFIAAQRFELDPAPAADGYRYLAIYEISTDDIAATLGELRTRSGTERMPIGTGLGKNSSTQVYRVRGGRCLA